MKIISTISTAVMLAVLAAAAPSSAQAQRGWVLLGEKTVSKLGDRDVVNARGEGRFSKIRLCVKRRPVHFSDLDVVFGNGRSQDLRVRRVIGPGECTRAIDIRGDDRFIRRIVMKYNTVGAYGRRAFVGPRAVVEVYGRR